MTLYGNIFAGGKRYDVTDAGSNKVAKFALNGTYYGTRLSASQTSGGVSFAVKGISYIVNPDAKTGDAKIKLGSTYYYIVKAATPVPTPTPTPTPSPTPTPVPTSTKPTAANTGPTQTPTKSAVPIKAGGVYDGYKFAGLTIKLPAGQTVKLTNCKIDAGGSSYAVNTHGNLGTVIIDHCELVNVDSCAVYGEGFHVTNCYVHQSGGDGFKPGKNCLIQCNYVTDLGRNAGSHADGVQIRGGTNIKVIGNNFNQAGDVHCNRNILVQLAGNANIEFSGNWCSCSGDYAIQMYDSTQPTTNRVENNTFAKIAGKRIMHTQSGIVISGNVYEDGTPAK